VTRACDCVSIHVRMGVRARGGERPQIRAKRGEKNRTKRQQNWGKRSK